MCSAVALLRRMINNHDSWTHRLPPEMLVEVAFHFKSDTSLVVATHVCHFWRTTLISSPRLWSHLDFTDEERALVYLERSKLAPLSVSLVGLGDPSEIVRESLKKITSRTITLWAPHDLFLDELLAQSMPKLEHFEIFDSDELPPKKPTHLPSLTSLAIHGFDSLRYHTSILTSFHLMHNPTSDSGEWTTSVLLEFFQNCPLLESASLFCDVHPDSDEVVSLPLLRSFTHESPWDEYQLCLLDRLSLPSTCRVALVIDVTEHQFDPWARGLLTPRNSSYLAGTRTVRISAQPHNPDTDEDHATFKVEFVNSTRRIISFDRISYHSKYPSNFSHHGFLDVFEKIETGSIETLCFYHCPTYTHDTLSRVTAEYITQGLLKLQNLKTLILMDCDITPSLDALSSCPTIDSLVVYSAHLDHTIVVATVGMLAVSRKKAGSPLRALTLVFPSGEPRPSILERLTSCVGQVEFLSGGEAVRWDVDKYLLGATTHEDNSNRS